MPARRSTVAGNSPLPPARAERMSMVEQWIRPQIRALSAYPVPDAQGMIKLDAMENPYGLPEELVPGWLEHLRAVPLNRYPDPAAGSLRARLRETLALPGETALMLGNGSDELIQMIAMAVAGPGRTVLAPSPSFVMYRMIAIYAGLSYVGVPLSCEGFELNEAAMMAAIDRYRPAVVFLAYPNNPTGNLWSRPAMERIVEYAPGLVVVDEAYAPFASDSFMDRVGDHPNLLVMRTLSKMGLAGLRLGYLVGPEPWLSELEKLRLPYNINALTQASADFALSRQEAFDRQAARIREDRGLLSAVLAALPGIRVFPSEANFILFTTPAGAAERVFRCLRAHGVLIKNLSGQPGLENGLRVTVGTPDENRSFVRALQDCLEGMGHDPA